MDFILAWLFLAFTLGTIIGSFLNVVILRYNSGRSPLTGRSHCFSCGKVLAWYELVPLASWLVLRGRCSDCRRGISVQYPAVEAATGLLFACAVAAIGVPQTFLAGIQLLLVLGVLSILLVISVYDMRHKIIPDGFVLALIAFGFGLHLVTFFPQGLDFGIFLGALIAGPVLFAPFFFLWYFSGGRWIGLGDGKLAFGIGATLGLSQGISALLFGFWAATIVALSLMLTQKILSFRLFRLWGSKKGLTMKSEMPFGPFLAFGTVLVLLFGVSALSLADTLIASYV